MRRLGYKSQNTRKVRRLVLVPNAQRVYSQVKWLPINRNWKVINSPASSMRITRKYAGNVREIP